MPRECIARVIHEPAQPSRASERGPRRQQGSEVLATGDGLRHPATRRQRRERVLAEGAGLHDQLLLGVPEVAEHNALDGGGPERTKRRHISEVIHNSCFHGKASAAIYCCARKGIVSHQLVHVPSQRVHQRSAAWWQPGASGPSIKIPGGGAAKAAIVDGVRAAHRHLMQSCRTTTLL